MTDAHMDFVKIKNMVRENGDKVIIMENGEPELVVMSFAEYEKLARLSLPETPRMQSRKTVSQDNSTGMQESIDDIPHETEFMAPPDTASIQSIHAASLPESFMRPDARTSDIRLEDLPI